MNKHLILGLSFGVACAGILRADGATPAAKTDAAAADVKAAATAVASPAPAAAKDAAKSADAKDAAPAAVAKNDAPGSLKAGNALLDQGKYAEAAAYFEGIGEQDAANGKAKREPYRLLGLATAYLQLGKYAEAETAATQAVALKKDLAPAWNDLASAQVFQGQRDKAIATYTKAIADLKAAQVDTAKLEANLNAIQIEADKKKGAKAEATDAAAPAASSDTAKATAPKADAAKDAPAAASPAAK